MPSSFDINMPKLKPVRERELECIEISRKYRARIVDRLVNQYKAELPPIFLTPHYLRHNLLSGQILLMVKTTWWQKVLKFLLLLFLYLLLVFIWTPGILFDYIRNPKRVRKYKEKLQKQYAIDNASPMVKTFSELWQTKGLVVYREVNNPIPGASNKELKECMREWMYVLYGCPKTCIDEFYKEKQGEYGDILEEWYKNHSDGHISLVSIESLLPELIDKTHLKYG